MSWYTKTGPEGDVVVSTRIRLARNIDDVPFPSRMTEAQGDFVVKSVKDAFFSANSACSKDFEFYDMQNQTPARAASLVEKHIVSPEFANERKGRALIISKDQSVSIMINEEDHIRIQALMPGMQLYEALDSADRIDNLLDEKLHYAFDENLGYLTSCPTNLGTGLRASLMLHLPAIGRSGMLQNLANAVSKLGLTIRGTYGEGSEAKGGFFQISNQVTLGITEKEAVENLKSIVGQIIAQERSAREAFKKAGPSFEDRIYRSLGILRNARVLNSEEFMELISEVRLGIATGLIGDVSMETVGRLISEVQPATLTASAGKNLDAAGRDFLRAQTVRERLK